MNRPDNCRQNNPPCVLVNLDARVMLKIDPTVCQDNTTTIHYYPIRNLSKGQFVDHWNSSVARRSPLKAILGFPIISNNFQYRKCRFSDIVLFLDMPMISGTESLEFPVQIDDFRLL